MQLISLLKNHEIKTKAIYIYIYIPPGYFGPYAAEHLRASAVAMLALLLSKPYAAAFPSIADDTEGHPRHIKTTALMFSVHGVSGFYALLPGT